MAQLNYSDFYQVPDLKFDIKKLREDLDKVLNDVEKLKDSVRSNIGKLNGDH